jgi:hypothetical protein
MTELGGSIRHRQNTAFFRPMSVSGKLSRGKYVVYGDPWLNWEARLENAKTLLWHSACKPACKVFFHQFIVRRDDEPVHCIVPWQG